MRMLGAVLLTTAFCIGACGSEDSGALYGTGGTIKAGGSSGRDASAGNGGDASLTGGEGGSAGRDAAAGTGADAGLGGSGGSTTLADACDEASYQEQTPLDMFIMMDQSGSMASSAGGAWDPIVSALTTFVQSSDSIGIGVGIGYFPLQVPCSAGVPGCTCGPFGCGPPTISDCNANHYAIPDVPIALLPGVASQIIASLGNHTPTGGTPTYPALQGAMQYALAHAVGAVGRKTIVILATDGDPNDCNSTIANVSSVAAAGFANNPQILTFVIGIGNVANLDEIAQAGGTGQALIVGSPDAGADAAADAGEQFLDAMNKIRGFFGMTTTLDGGCGQ